MTFEFALYHLVFVGILVLLTQSLNLVWKINLFSLGHHGFFCVGTYTTVAILRGALGEPVQWPLVEPIHRVLGAALLLATVIVGASVAGLIAALLGRSIMRLKDDYFAVATLVFAEIMWLTMANWDYVGGGRGVELPYLVFDNSPGELLFFLFMFASLVLTLNTGLYKWIASLEDSMYGMYIDAIRDDELAAGIIGIDIDKARRIVFTLGAVVAGASGAVFAHFVTVIAPDDFRFLNGLPVVLYVVLGNLGIRMCIVASVAVYVLYELIKLQFFGFFGEDLGQFILAWKEAFYAVGLLAIIMGRAYVLRPTRQRMQNHHTTVGSTKSTMAQ